MVDGDMIYLCIPTCSAEGQGSLAMQKPEVWKWRPMRSGHVISRGEGSIDVPCHCMSINKLDQGQLGTLAQAKQAQKTSRGAHQHRVHDSISHIRGHVVMTPPPTRDPGAMLGELGRVQDMLTECVSLVFSSKFYRVGFFS